MVVGVDELGPWIALSGLAVGLITAVALAVAIWKGQAGPALAYLREANEALVKKSEESERLAAEAEQKLKLVEEQVMLMQERTSFEPMVAAVILQFDSHEQRAAERHLATLHILDLIARRLGPEPNGG